jgi:hypothetical protein
MLKLIGWRRLTPPGVKFVELLHQSGWRVRHCGHPTANWPYYLSGPGMDECIVSWVGRGFRHLDAAQFAVEMILRGDTRVVDGMVEHVSAIGTMI